MSSIPETWVASGVPAGARPLGLLEETMILLRELVTSVARLAAGHRRRRTREEVNGEYDGRCWSSILADQPWLRAADLSAFVNPSGREIRIAKIDNRLVRLTDAEYYRYRGAMLRSVIEREAGDAIELAEIGCGYGHNLFTLALDDRWRRLAGFDVSAAGVEAGLQIAAHFGLSDRVKFERLDLTDDSALAFARLRGLTVFSYYCLEQLKYDTGRVLENLRRAGVRRVIHIEPLAEVLSLASLRDLVNYLYIRRQDYQDNLLRTLRGLEREGKVRVLSVRRLLYAPGPRHDAAVIVWDPRAEGAA
jgi:SAM-dependent methyltransferase